MELKKVWLGVLALSLLAGCHREEQLRRAHGEVHAGLVQMVKAAVTRTEAEIEKNVQALQSSFRNENCGTKKVSKLSSMYLPTSRVKGKRLDCFEVITLPMDELWKGFYETTDFVSWLYVYDQETRAMRIYPATNTETLFGKNLVFDYFMFYQLAVKNYPKSVWVPIKFDINGTGRILIHSRAVRLPHSKSFTTVSADIRPAQFLRDYQEKLIEFAHTKGLEHLFVYGYQIDDNVRTLAHDFSSNPSKWKILRSVSGGSLHLAPADEKELLQLEGNARNSESRQAQANLKIDGLSHYCTMSYVEQIGLYSVMCSEN